MGQDLKTYFEKDVPWIKSGDVYHPYEATVEGVKWVLRLGDFPEEPLFTLLIDDNEIGTFDDWPESWVRPK